MISTDKIDGFGLFTISSDEISITVADYGATLLRVLYKGKNRVLSYAAPAEYTRRHSYLGAVIGRYANRIAGSRFALNGQEYSVVPNENGNQLHGGPDAFDKRIWKAEAIDDLTVRFTLFSPDGDNGFPGDLEASVTYSVEGSSFRMDFGAKAASDTIYAPTTHTYWQIDGADVREDTLTINADRYLPVDAQLIPTGEVLPAEGAFDFRIARKVGQTYDHCFILRGGEPALVLEGGDATMKLYTDFDAVQMYTGPIDGFTDCAGLALEPEFCPDSPNRPELGDPVLRAGQIFSKYIEYRFS